MILPPPCFTPEAFLRYAEAALESEPVPNYCFDCTASYQRRMLALDKCVHPETVFVERREDDHPFINRVGMPESFVVGERE